jgi:hypothetical protein
MSSSTQSATNTSKERTKSLQAPALFRFKHPWTSFKVSPIYHGLLIFVVLTVEPPIPAPLHEMRSTISSASWSVLARNASSYGRTTSQSVPFTAKGKFNVSETDPTGGRGTAIPPEAEVTAWNPPKSGTSPKLEKIHIDPQRIPIDRTSKPLLEFLQEYERDIQEFTDLLPKKSTLMLSYERDIERDPCIGYLKICNILNIRPHRKRIPLSKTTSFPIRELVENFDDLQATLRGTPSEWMLEE